MHTNGINMHGEGYEFTRERQVFLYSCTLGYICRLQCVRRQERDAVTLAWGEWKLIVRISKVAWIISTPAPEIHGCCHLVVDVNAIQLLLAELREDVNKSLVHKRQMKDCRESWTPDSHLANTFIDAEKYAAEKNSIMHRRMNNNTVAHETWGRNLLMAFMQ